jgi:phospholipase/carboxylesterase
MFDLPDYQFIFPNAPFFHPQVPGGRAWYALETDTYKGLSESRQMLLDWLLGLEEKTGVPLSRTILGGFSQGAAMVLDVGLNLPVAGLCSLSGFLHADPEPNSSTLPPILMVHGKYDPVVPLAAARQAKDELIALGAPVEYREFDMGHEITPPVLELIQQFVLARE